MAASLSNFFEREIAGAYPSVFPAVSGTKDSARSQASGSATSKRRYVSMNCEVFDAMQDVLAGMQSASVSTSHKRRYQDICAFEEQCGVKEESLSEEELNEREFVGLKEQLVMLDKTKLVALLTSVGVDKSQPSVDLRSLEKKKLRRLFYMLQKDREAAFIARRGDPEK